MRTYDSNINIISAEYLFSPELVEALITGKLPLAQKYDNNKFTNKNDVSLYLVFIRILNKEDKKLVYNYVSYNLLFMMPLMMFLLNRQKYNAEYFSEWGRYFVVLQNSTVEEAKADFLKQLSFNDDYIKKDLYNPGKDMLSVDPFTFLNSLTYKTCPRHMSNLIDLSFKKAFGEYLKEVLYPTPLYEVFKNNVDSNIEHHNLLNSCLFLVLDLNVFKTEIESKGYSINEGPKKWRGQIGALSSQINCLDRDFRKALYQHNLFHSWNYKPISKDRFSFNNIHMNLGNVRWFSS